MPPIPAQLYEDRRYNPTHYEDQTIPLRALQTFSRSPEPPYVFIVIKPYAMSSTIMRII